MKRIIRFERLILFPLDLAFIFLALMYFIKADWLGGVFALIVSLVLGMIGQSLHKNQTAGQLLRGEHLFENEGEDSHRLSPTESNLLGKALVQSTIVLAIAFAVLAIHSTTDEWWLVIVKAISLAIIFPLLSVFLILMLPKIIDGIRGKG